MLAFGMRVIDRLVELGAAATRLDDYERGALDAIASRVGFDVGMFARGGEPGVCCPGLDPAIVARCRLDWPVFEQELVPVVEAALQQRGVAVDIDVLGRRSVERTAHYQRLVRPHGGTATAIVCLTRRATHDASALFLGRTRGGFTDTELDELRAVVPALSVCDAAIGRLVEPVADRELGAQLTPREREVLSYLHLGYTNAQIASALGTAERTVRNQLTSAYQKLGVATRAEAVAVIQRLGRLAH